MLLNEILTSGIDLEINNYGDVWVADGYLSNSSFLEVTAVLDDGKWTIDFKINDEYDLTGLGNEFEVFSTVTSTIKHFITDKEPDYIIMSADSQSRLRLYTRIINRLLPDWVVDTEGGDYEGFVIHAHK